MTTDIDTRLRTAHAAVSEPDDETRARAWARLEASMAASGAGASGAARDRAGAGGAGGASRDGATAGGAARRAGDASGAARDDAPPRSRLPRRRSRLRVALPLAALVGAAAVVVVALLPARVET